MNMLARHRTPGRFDLELVPQPLEELVKSVFNYFPGFRSDLLFGGPVNSRMEIDVTDKTVEVKFPCPGRCKDDFELEIVGDFLTVKAVKCCHHDNQEDSRHYIIKERSCETYEESVKLPVPVKGADTKAKYTHGVLEISIPRLVEEQSKAHIVKIS